MSLSPGAKFGPYEVVAPIGAGGMGEVYRGKDTRLGREVALKVLPATLVNDAAYMNRFRREAQVLASLNHPHIAIIHGLEANAIVMELVDGVTLAERIAQGPIPIDEAIDIARQIAEAFEYAHEKGVVHRDLKPANVKITPEGVVKVLDFGIARMADAPAAPGNPESSPTLTLPATQAGMIMGTAAYMAPEQAAGKTVDRRADIWSFGVVLWEMLTGRKLFAGETVSHTLADVLRAPIEFQHLPAATPSRIRHLLERCLDRNPKTRLRDIGEARVLLSTPASIEPEPPAAKPTHSRLAWALAAAATIALAIAAFGWWKATRPTERPLLFLADDLGSEAVVRSAVTTVLSPDGTRIVFAAQGKDGRIRLAIRPLQQHASTTLAGTEEATFPFFSPDSQWIAFFADGKLKKIPAAGGVAISLCDAPNGRGGSWGEDGNIIASLTQNAGLSRVPDAGGSPQPLTKPTEKGERTHRFPQILPGGQSVIFTSAVGTDYDSANIAIANLRTGEWRTVDRGYFGRYVPSGYLLWMRDGALVGAPFDVGAGKITGPSATLMQEIAGNPAQGGGQFDFSQTGMFVFMKGRSSDTDRQIVWLDSDGKVEPILATPGPYSNPRLSPDAKFLAITTGKDIAVYDFQRKNMIKLTFTGRNGNPVWSPDGRHIVYASQEGASRIMWIRGDGAGEPMQLLAGGTSPQPSSFSPDGRRLAYADLNPQTGIDIWTVPIEGTDSDHPKPGKPEPFLRSTGSDLDPAFSPDGHWIAHVSSESGVFEVYVRPFPGPGGKWQISSGGGNAPAWAPGGHSLFYIDFTGRLIEVPYTTKGDSFLPETSRRWAGTLEAFRRGASISPSRDGKRIVSVPPSVLVASAAGNLHVNFLINYFDELKRRLPPGAK